MIRIGVLGSSGKMGRKVCELLETEFREKATIAARGTSKDMPPALFSADVVIDFSLPAGALAFAGKALEAPKAPALVVASTGWRIEERDTLEELSRKAPVLMSSNFSTGVLAFLEIMKFAAPLLQKAGYAPVLIEKHHKHKKDAPSGTAMSIQRTVSPMGPGNVPVYSVRAGEVVGDHEVTFYGPGDQLAFKHHAQDRSIFARGAIEAALWLASKRSDATALGSIIGPETYAKALFHEK